jgi:hypothetical protein
MRRTAFRLLLSLRCALSLRFQLSRLASSCRSLMLSMQNLRRTSLVASGGKKPNRAFIRQCETQASCSRTALLSSWAHRVFSRAIIGLTYIRKRAPGQLRRPKCRFHAKLSLLIVSTRSLSRSGLSMSITGACGDLFNAAKEGGEKGRPCEGREPRESRCMHFWRSGQGLE